jgi:predicted nucleotidyltransferase
MDLSDPTRAVTSTLDGAVLAALAVAGRPLTVGQVAERAARGSEIGIRRCLARLVEQGTVRATQMGRNVVHELNRDHVAAQIAVLLAGLRSELWDRLRVEVGSWSIKPIYAAVFGSAARGDGGDDSDIDLLLVHPPFSGEPWPKDVARRVRDQLVDAVGIATLAPTDPEADQQWQQQLDRVRDRVEAWTGNALQIVDMSFREWRRPPASYRPLLADVERDGIEIRRARGLSLWPSVEAAGAEGR